MNCTGPGLAATYGADSFCLHRHPENVTGTRPDSRHASRARLIKCRKILHGLSAIRPGAYLCWHWNLAHEDASVLLNHSSLEGRKRFFSWTCVLKWNSFPLLNFRTVNTLKGSLHGADHDFLRILPTKITFS